MREGFDAPTAVLPEQDAIALRDYFDAQSRIELAVWVRHEQRGADGPLYDHHLVLGVDDEDYASGDMWALELGMNLPGLCFDGPIWAPDIFALSEVEALRAFGAVVWEGPGSGDPLDFSLTWEPFEADPDDVARFGRLIAAERGIRRVEATRQRLWRGREEVASSSCFFVDADGVRLAVSIVGDAAREALPGVGGVSLGLPRDPRIRTATVYETTR